MWLISGIKPTWNHKKLQLLCNKPRGVSRLPPQWNVSCTFRLQLTNKQMKRQRKKRIVFTRKGKKKPLHIKLLNGHDPQFQTAYQQHGNPNNRNKQQANRETVEKREE